MPNEDKMKRDPEIIKTGVPYQGDGKNANDLKEDASDGFEEALKKIARAEEREANLRASITSGMERSINAKQKLLEEAMETVKSRGEAYDGVEDNFARIARYWSAHMLNAYGIAFDFSPTDVAIMMILMKTARLDFNPTHRDSYVDVAGYAACGADVSGA